MVCLFDTQLKTLENPLPNINRFLIQQTARPDCRSTGRSTDHMHRSTVPNRELGTFSRSTGRSTALLLRSTGPVDRYSFVHVVHVGRPDRSTDLLLLRTVDWTGRPLSCCCADFFGCCCCFFDDIVDFLDDFLSLPTIVTPKLLLSPFGCPLWTLMYI